MIDCYKDIKEKNDYKNFIDFTIKCDRKEFSIIPKNHIYPELGIYSNSKVIGKRIQNQKKLHKSRKFSINNDYLVYYFDSDNQLRYTSEITFDANKNEWIHVFVTKIVLINEMLFSYRIRLPKTLLSFDSILTMYDFKEKNLYTYIKAWDELEIEIHNMDDLKCIVYSYNQSIDSFKMFSYDIDD